MQTCIDKDIVKGYGNYPIYNHSCEWYGNVFGI